MSDMGLVGRTIDHYRIEQLLGQGGMGSVFQAVDLHLQRPVALKVMHAHLAARQEFQQRFLQEARAAARLDHPGIVRVHAFGLEQGMLFMVMELITGGSLRGYLQHLYEQQKYIELPEAVELTRQVAEALDYAHKQGMIHRDIKPDNVILKLATDGGQGLTKFRAVLTDFGLAKLAEGGVQSVSGQPMGTYPYMSPEQCLAEDLDARTDIYALGVMLYELAVGRLPYLPKTITEAIRMHTREPLPPPEKYRPGAPAGTHAGDHAEPGEEPRRPLPISERAGARA
ncbi:MAG: serine/threonine protein kinase [Anaerolineae bacterium]|nr:serine/threonine protein kinase [Anaerolineae bacterium]